MRKERLKSVVLAVLFITCVAFTQRLWFHLPLGGVVSIANNDDEEINIDVTDILSPQSFSISFGGGNHAVFYSEPHEVWNMNKAEEKKEVSIWQTIKPVLKYYLKSDYEVREVTLEEWKKIKKFKSIRMDFACQIPGESLIEAFTGDERDTFQIEGSIGTILIPGIEDEKANIYLGNDEENIYFKLTGIDVNDGVRKLIENIEKNVDDRNYMYYVSLEDIADVENDVLAPVFEEAFIPSYNAINQIDVLDEVTVKSNANQFFGKNFDFVKQITEIDGTHIYMYGYGEKALKINKNGVLEYTEKIDKENSGINLGFLESLEYAVKFVGEKIGWPITGNAYLSDYEPIEKNGEKGYSFSFNYRLHGLPIYIPDFGEDRGIEVEVIGTQITMYKRRVKLSGKQLDDEENSQKRALDILEVLDKNSDDIKNSYRRFSERELTEEEIKNIKIEELIEDIGLVYYVDRNNVLKPVWEITIGNIVYYFDIYTGLIYTAL
ncbi:hypothetical protein [Wukongibacter sp. M2B1]|uniref:hypothetical protein n=1 Tax=Wukongibacter sp. M2B1 TaxID=3088895 RepID=UPI003D7B695F